MKKTTKKTLLYGIITASENELAETVSDEYVRSGHDTQQ